MLCRCQPSYAIDDDIVMQSIVDSGLTLDFHDCRMAMSIGTLYDYQNSIGLIFFNNKCDIGLDLSASYGSISS
jgi:hypothetical protein